LLISYFPIFPAKGKEGIREEFGIRNQKLESKKIFNFLIPYYLLPISYFHRMYSRWQMIAKYLRYFLGASNGKGHGTHSPFIFHFIRHVLNDSRHYPEYDTVERLRSSLLTDKTLLAIDDLGAGSRVNQTQRRTIGSIAGSSAKPRKLGQLLFRMVKEYQPSTVIEFGTSLGITSCYLALAKQDTRVITMEGAGEVAAVARKNFDEAGIRNIRVEEGNFDTILKDILEPLPAVGFAFIDGNHRQEPTERYFWELLPKTSNDSILVVDDIHWSREMEAAWETIRAHPQVRCSIDLFFTGLVFFREEFREKQHFSIRF
jgi:predicted O-methyltransferase YrrM